jgi:hypothetical protein
MGGETLDQERPQDVCARQEGHSAEFSERYTLGLSEEEMYVTLRALTRFAKQKRIRWQQLRRKYGASADVKYRDEAALAYGIIDRIHALTGGRFRFGTRDTGGD